MKIYSQQNNPVIEVELSDEWTVRYDRKRGRLTVTLFADNRFVDELYIDKQKFMELTED